VTAPAEFLKAPFPHFGGKSIICDQIWERFGNVDSYVEPFFGSGAVLFGRPHEPKIETANDLDGFICNAWRSMKMAPQEVAKWCDNPVFESDLHARHSWLVQRRDSLPAKLEGDPEFFDARIAGYWIWCKGAMIAGNLASGEGPWKVVNGQLLNVESNGDGINRSMPYMRGPGQGINRSMPQIVPRNTNRFEGDMICEWFKVLSNRLRRVRVVCGNWDRILGPSVTFGNGMCGLYFDPPYDDFDHLYRLKKEGGKSVAQEVRDWCVANDGNPQLRIGLSGYEGQYDLPSSWECVPWKAVGGYGNQKKNGTNDNCRKERIWFNSSCLRPELNLL
jgi:DNA adenine methylase